MPRPTGGFLVADNKRPAFVSLVKTRPYRDMNKTPLLPSFTLFSSRGALEDSALVGDPTPVVSEMGLFGPFQVKCAKGQIAEH